MEHTEPPRKKNSSDSPISLISTLPPVYGCSLSSFSCVNDVSLVFLQYPMVLVQSHKLRRLLEKSFKMNRSNPRLPFQFLVENLPASFAKVGYVSQCSFDSAFKAMKVFFQTNTFPLVYKDLSFLSNIASLFGAEIKSVSNRMQQLVSAHHLLDSIPIITELSLPIWKHVKESDCLAYSALIHVKRLDLGVYSTISFNYLKMFFINSVIQEFKILPTVLTVEQAQALGEVFLNTNTLNTVKIANRGLSPDAEELMRLCLALSSSKIQILSFSNLVLNSESFKSLNTHPQLREFILDNVDCHTKDLVQLLQTNVYMKKLQVCECSLKLFSEICYVLKTNLSL
ncbi:hypothetical protein GEMRC1_008023 [Eukaryota sp. GEM-RC1]